MSGGYIAMLERVVRDLNDQLEVARAETARLTLLINTPRTDEFFEAVRIEAAHQIGLVEARELSR